MKIIEKLYVVMCQRWDHILHNPIVTFFNREEAEEFVAEKLKGLDFKHDKGSGAPSNKDEYWHSFHRRFWIRETNLARLEDDEPYEGDDW